LWVVSFYETPQRIREMMRCAIALNGSFFNTHRMLLQYLFGAYRDPGPSTPRGDPRDVVA
jgi:starch phosphorylase